MLDLGETMTIKYNPIELYSLYQPTCPWLVISVGNNITFIFSANG